MSNISKQTPKTNILYESFKTINKNSKSRSFSVKSTTNITLNQDFYKKSVEIFNPNLQILSYIMDFSKRRFSAKTGLSIKYYKNVDGVLLLYDVSDETSFTDVQSWLNDVKQNSNRTADSDISLFLLANKIDKEDRKISREKGEELAKSLGMKYFEISCKNNINVHETMARMIMECYKRVSNTSNTSGNIQLSNQKGGKPEF